MTSIQVALSFGSGGLVGLSLGVIGGGGSILAVPLMVYLVGVSSPHVAIGTSAVAVAATIVHDLGKIRVPAEILSKPGRLTRTEYELSKGHAEAGYDIPKPIAFPWPIADIVHQHHKRMDGSGYPQCLKGEGIILEARIVAVADVVEAMMSQRPFRATLGIGAALAEIENGKSILYDPAVADS